MGQLNHPQIWIWGGGSGEGVGQHYCLAHLDLSLAMGGVNFPQVLSSRVQFPAFFRISSTKIQFFPLVPSGLADVLFLTVGRRVQKKVLIRECVVLER